MDKKKKGLADEGDGEFILNESGSSVSSDRGPAEENIAGNTGRPQQEGAAPDGEDGDPAR